MNYIHYLTFYCYYQMQKIINITYLHIHIITSHIIVPRIKCINQQENAYTHTRTKYFLYSLVDWQWQTNKQILLYVTDTVSLAFLQEVDVAFYWLVSSFYCDCEIYFLYLKLIFINLFISESQNCIKAVKTLIPISCPTTTPKWWHNKHSMSSFFLTNLSYFFCSSQSYM